MTGADRARTGGRILVDEQAVPGMGSFCLFADPDDRVLGIWKQSGPMSE